MATGGSKKRSSRTGIEIPPDICVLIGLFVVLFAVRLPSFFFSVFDWDESTFIIVGQSILNGNMPYVDAWNIKPPLAYYAYALFIAVFGKSILSIRLGGALCIYAASIVVYKTGQALNDRIAGLSATLFLVAFTASGPSGLSVMTEHILLIPISFILYLLLTVDINKKVAFIAGILLGIGIMMKSNMVFESLALLVLLLSGLLSVNVKFLDRAERCFDMRDVLPM